MFEELESPKLPFDQCLARERSPFSPSGRRWPIGRMSDGLKLVQVTDSKKDIFEFLSVWQMCFAGSCFLAETLGASPQTLGIFLGMAPVFN